MRFVKQYLPTRQQSVALLSGQTATKRPIVGTFLSAFLTLLFASTALVQTNLTGPTDFTGVKPTTFFHFRPPIADKRALSGFSKPDAATRAKIVGDYGKLPLSFEVNHGQTDSQVKFLSRGRSYSFFLMKDEAVLALSRKKQLTGSNKHQKTAESLTGAVLRMKLRNANAAAKIIGVDELAGTSNYLIGNDPAKWQTKVPTYAKVKYEGVYSGIDLVYYGNQRQLEYDFIVTPGADPRRIAFDVHGAKRTRLDAKGDLVFMMGEDVIRWHKPVVYQEKDGAQQLVAARYEVTDKDGVRFKLGKYDETRPLYIDPLIYSTYLGGSNNDSTDDIAVDSAGNAYVSGVTFSADLPTTPGSFQPVCNNHCDFGDAFVAKINPEGSALVYSTFLGGSLSEYAYAIAVDGAGNAYVTGATESTDFPTKNPLQPNFGGGLWDGFVAEINSDGSDLVYSTFLGGSGDENRFGAGGIAVDSLGNTYVHGSTNSPDFPTTSHAFRTTCNRGSNCNVYGDDFVARISPGGSALVYSTFLGGSNSEIPGGIAVDSAGNAYVSGSTKSADFPTTSGAFQPKCGDGNHCPQFEDAFVAKLNPSGSALAYSTYLGGQGNDFGHGIAVDSAGSAYVTGWTTSTNFPTMNPLQPASGGGTFDAFVSKLNPSGSNLVYSTYLGGKSGDWGMSVAVDGAGDAYVTGQTESPNFPVVSPVQNHLRNGINITDVFVSKLNAAGSALLFSTYLGGGQTDNGFRVAVDSSGNAYVTGNTGSKNFPTMNPMQAHLDGLSDGFVAKISVATTTTTLTSSPNPSALGQAVTFTAVVTASNGPTPDGETVSFMKGRTVLGTGMLSGGSTNFTTSALPVGNNKIKAVYGGDAILGGSTSNAVTQLVK